MSKHKKIIVEHIMIVVGILLMNIGFYFFFLPQGLVTGGVYGVAIILEKNTRFSIDASYTAFALNSVFLIIGFILTDRKYMIKTLFGSIFLPLVLFSLEILKVPQDFIIKHLNESPVFLSVVLGSLFVGFGVGLVFRNGGSTGGVDIAQNIMRKKLHLSYPVIFAITDMLVVTLGFIVFKDVQNLLYAVGGIVLMSLIVDNLSIAGRAGHTLFVVTEKEEEVKQSIFNKIERGVTVLDAKGGYSDGNKQLIICVIHKRELNLTREIIEQADPEAFTFIAQTKEAVGYGFTR